MLLALPVAAEAKPKKAKRFFKSGWEARAVLRPPSGDKPRGVTFLRQHDGALTVALKVAGLAPWSRHAAEIGQGTCASGPSVVPFPDLIANGKGVARLWITLPTDPGKDYAENGFYVNVHAAFGATPGASITCGAIQENPANGVAKVRPVGDASKTRGLVRLHQAGDKVRERIDLNGLAPNSTHAVIIRTGADCAHIGDAATQMPDISANGRGAVHIGQFKEGITTDVVGPNLLWVVHDGPSANHGAPVGCGKIVGRFRARHWASDGDPWWTRWWFN
jgi:hypothetical protein